MNYINKLIKSDNTDISKYEHELKKLNGTLNNNKNKKKDDTTNYLWKVITILEIKIGYLYSFNYIKNGNFYDAWCNLEYVEIKISNLENNCSTDILDFYNVKFYKNYVFMWQSLFPYTLFLSMGFIARDFSCSICSKILTPRNQCIHKKGKVYDGELCLHICNKIDDIKEVSFVKNPMQKACIPLLDYDYSLVRFTSERLESPFDGWAFNKTKSKVSRDKFVNVKPDSVCPCREGNKNFINCCYDKSFINIPHIDIIFDKGFSPSLQNNYFPYD